MTHAISLSAFSQVVVYIRDVTRFALDYFVHVYIYSLVVLLSANRMLLTRPVIKQKRKRALLKLWSQMISHASLARPTTRYARISTQRAVTFSSFSSHRCNSIAQVYVLKHTPWNAFTDP